MRTAAIGESIAIFYDNENKVITQIRNLQIRYNISPTKKAPFEFAIYTDNPEKLNLWRLMFRVMSIL